LGDIFAMGARPQTATAIATVPPGLDRQTHATLTQMMTGAVEVLNAAGCTLVGGHTGEGQELALGFAINGLVEVTPQGELQGVMRKAGMQAGDVLLLTKPLGTGTLFAAHALGLARGRWIEAALRQMEQIQSGRGPNAAGPWCTLLYRRHRLWFVGSFGRNDAALWRRCRNYFGRFAGP